MSPSPHHDSVALFETAAEPSALGVGPGPSAGARAAFSFRRPGDLAPVPSGRTAAVERPFDFAAAGNGLRMHPPLPPSSFRHRRRGCSASPKNGRRVRRMSLDESTNEMPLQLEERDSDEIARRGSGGAGDFGWYKRRSDDAEGIGGSEAVSGGGSAPKTDGLEGEGEGRGGGSGFRLSDVPAESVALLNLVAIIWGTQHSVIKTVVDDCDASAFSFARFGLAALLASKYTPPIGPLLRRLAGGAPTAPEKKVDDEEVGSAGRDGSEDGAAAARGPAADAAVSSDEAAVAAWRWGLEMGAWMFLGYAFQAIGLAFTTAQRSGFLLYLNVKFVPFFARILFGREISAATWASALAALAGTALLSYDGSSAALNVGDLWSVAAAAASAMFILRLESASGAVRDSGALNAASLWTVTTAALIWSIGENVVLSPSQDLAMLTQGALSAVQATADSVVQTVASHPFALIYLGGVTTALANYIQTKAQRNITAERASIIYAMDPVYGAFFASVLLGERLNGFGAAGAGVITLAAATNAFLDLGSGNKDTGDAKLNENK